MVNSCTQPRGQALFLEIRQERVRSLVPKQVGMVLYGFGSVIKPRIRKNPGDRKFIFVLHWHVSNEHALLVLCEGELFDQIGNLDILVFNAPEVCIGPSFLLVQRVLGCKDQAHKVGRVPLLVERKKFLSDAGRVQRFQVATVEAVEERLGVGVLL